VCLPLDGVGGGAGGDPACWWFVRLSLGGVGDDSWRVVTLRGW